MKKLSEQLLEMSKRTAAFETQVSVRNEENKQEFEAEVAEARKSVQASQEAFANKLDSMHDSITSHWREVQQNFKKQVATARSKAAERKASMDLSAAQTAADLDENAAQIAIEFAQWAAAEANAAIAQANQSRAYAKSLEKTPAKTTA